MKRESRERMGKKILMTMTQWHGETPHQTMAPNARFLWGLKVLRKAGHVRRIQEINEGIASQGCNGSWKDSQSLPKEGAFKSTGLSHLPWPTWGVVLHVLCPYSYHFQTKPHIQNIQTYPSAPSSLLQHHLCHLQLEPTFVLFLTSMGR